MHNALQLLSLIGLVEVVKVAGPAVSALRWPETAAEAGQIRLAETITLTATEVAAVQHQVRSRVLRWFVRVGYLDPTDALDMAAWEHGGGFSRDASVRSEAPDRAGLERLLRY